MGGGGARGGAGLGQDSAGKYFFFALQALADGDPSREAVHDALNGRAPWETSYVLPIGNRPRRLFFLGGGEGGGDFWSHQKPT